MPIASGLAGCARRDCNQTHGCIMSFKDATIDFIIVDSTDGGSFIDLII